MFLAIVDMSGRIIELHSEDNRDYAERRAQWLNQGSDTNSYRVVRKDFAA